MALSPDKTKKESVKVPEGLKDTATKATPKATGAKVDHKAISEVGEEIISTMTQEQVEVLGSKSNTLTFRYYLGLHTKKNKRAIGKTPDKSKNETIACSTHVGALFVSSEPIEVPVLHPQFDHKTGFTASDVGTRKVAAGEEFALNLTEIMLLITRPEYAGVCNRNEKEGAISFSPKMQGYNDGKQFLPTPTLRARVDTGAIKSDMVDIDTVDLGDGKFDIVPEFKEQFAHYLKSHNPTRSASGAKRAKTNNNDRNVSVAIADIISKAINK